MSSSTPPELDAISTISESGPPSPSWPPSWSGLSTQTGRGLTTFTVLTTLLSRAGTLYFVGPPWREATTIFIHGGPSAPFVALTLVLLAGAAPELLGRIVSTLKAIPFLFGAKKE